MPQYVLRPSIWALTATLSVSVALATPRLPFRHYTTADGLPQSQVLTLHQDRQGELWVGTWNGAAHYDGAQFRYLNLRMGLPNSVVFDIEENEAGDLFFAAGTAIARLGRDRSKVAETYTPEISEMERNWFRDLYFDRRGVLWAAADLGGVVALEQGRTRFVETPPLATDVRQVLAETAAGELLLGTSEGVFVIEGDRARPYRSRAPWNRPIHLLHRGEDGGFLIADSEGLWRVDEELTLEITVEGRSILAVHAVFVDRFEQLWVATETGLYRRINGRMARLGKQEGLPGEGRFYSLLEDREGNLWIGSDDGLSLHPGDLFRIYLASEGWSDTSIWSLAIDPDDQLLIGTEDGVVRFDGDRFEPLPEPHPLKGKRIRTTLADATGGLWFGTHKEGLFHWDGRSWHHYLPPMIPATRIYTLSLDSAGQVWITTPYGVVSYRGGEFRIWTTEDGLPTNMVKNVREDHSARILAATSEGLARLESGRFHVPDEFSVLEGVPIRCLVAASDGTLWVGTEGLGLYRRIGGEWRIYPAGEGPADDFAWGLIEDQGGKIWLATNHGLDLYDGERWTHFSKRDGLITDELASNAALATPDGAAWFGFPGGGGLVRFPAEQPRAMPTEPIVRITSVKTAKREALEPPFRLTLPFQERDVSFSYISVSFRDEKEVSYRTMLEGYDPAFTLPHRDRSVRYTNLSPGSYRFLVLASSADGTWSKEPVAVDLEILSPFYLTWWFYLLSAGAVAFAALAFHRLKMRAMAREKQLLEARVEERTREVLSEKKKLQDALDRVRTLSGLLPICASCNKIRDEEGLWRGLEAYIEGHSEASFSHAICPTCAHELYPELYPERT